MTADQSAAAPKAEFDATSIASAYSEAAPLFDALCEEAAFILKEKVDAAGIRIHQIETRRKELASILRKAEEKNIVDPVKELRDIAGLRLICLFRSDLPKLEEIIATNFEVIERDDKVTASDDTFGYMSVHFVARMKGGFQGPRYDKLKGHQLEIQLRTICMHAWAAVSHHLEYKADWDVPSNLKKSLNALSGLFYVADEQFERFAEEREKFVGGLAKSAPRNTIAAKELNLDTLVAFLNKRYPDRLPAKRGLSDFLSELVAHKITDLNTLEKAIDAGEKALLAYEKDHNRTHGALGAARISLAMSREDYRKSIYSPGIFSKYVS